jgi:hypothetical protein
MGDKIQECIGRIEGMVREDRLKQSLKEGKTDKACGDSGSSNASNKSNTLSGSSLLFFLKERLFTSLFFKRESDRQTL